MPTVATINSQKYYNQLKNGKTFGTLTDWTNNLVGSVAERLRIVTEVSVYCSAITTPKPWNLNIGSYTFFYYDDTLKQLTRNTGSFLTDGLSQGDTVAIRYLDSTGTLNGDFLATIGSLNDNVITFTGTPMDGATPLEDSSTIGSYSYMEVILTSWLTALIFKFGLIGNNETFNVISKVSGNEQAYYGASIGADNGGGGRLTTGVTLTKLGNFQDWITGTATCAYTSTTDYSQKFTITHDIIVSPWYIKEWQQNLINGTTPTLLAGGNSLKYVIECDFRTVLSNPNTSKIIKVSNVLGCIGWFNENFNGFNNIYSVDSCTYTDTILGTAVDAPQVARKTRAVITLSKSGGTFNAKDPFGVCFSYLPNDQSEYQNKLTTQEANFVFDNAVNDEVEATTTGTNSIIKYCTGAISAGKLVITIDLEFALAQQALMQATPTFLISCLIADDTLTAANSDKVQLLADFGYMVYSADIPNLFGTDAEKEADFLVTRHDGLTATQMTWWNEDGANAYFRFWLETALSAYINTIDFSLIAYKASTGDYFILDNKTLNCQSFPLVGGIQQLYINSDRGYNLAYGDIFNEIKLQLDNLSGTKQFYTLSIGQKIKWQSWIQNLFATTNFYDNTQTFNGLNQKSSNYSSLETGDSDWDIRMMLSVSCAGIDSFGNQGTSLTRLISPEQFVYDYEGQAAWAATIETFTEDGLTNLGGKILYNANTLMKVTWTYSLAIDYYNYAIFAIHRIEEANEIGDGIYEHSTFADRITAAPFADVTGAPVNRLKTTIDFDNNIIITENLIDYTKLDQSKEYKLSARLSYDQP